jgi:hypothetical protein
MSEWQDVSQVPDRRRDRGPRHMRLALAPLGRGKASMLCLSVPRPVVEALGWALGDKLGLALGQGRTAGWLRIGPDPLGRPLTRLGEERRDTLMVRLAAPEAWRHLTAPSMTPEHRVQGRFLLVELPWDMTDPPPPAPDEEPLQ